MHACSASSARSARIRPIVPVAVLGSQWGCYLASAVPTQSCRIRGPSRCLGACEQLEFVGASGSGLRAEVVMHGLDSVRNSLLHNMFDG